MATTVTGAVREAVLGLGLFNQRVWSDRAPDNPTFPYVVLHDSIDMQPALRGDRETLQLERFIQVSVWFQASREDKSIAQQVYTALDGARFTLDSGARLICSAQGMPRILDDSTNIVHRPLTLSCKHHPTAF